MKKQKNKLTNTIQIKNKKAAFSYQILEKYLAGIVLKGAEIKSIRLGKVNLKDAYCYFSNNQLYTKSMNISPYQPASYANEDPERPRKLLLKKKELIKIQKQKKEKSYTIIPLQLFINKKGWAKLEIALAKGKKLYDKRAAIKERDIKRTLKKKLIEV